MFVDILNNYDFNDLKKFIHSRSERDVELALSASKIDEDHFAALLSPAAENFIEPMAAEAHRITKQRFGNTIKIYAPLYLSNECTNSCVYCGFNTHNTIPRVTLSDDEIKQEVDHIASLGIQHLLLVTGESPKQVGIDYLVNALKLMSNKYSSIAIEVFPMSVEDYSIMYQNGVDGLTVYQETYNRDKYAEVHPAGKKRDFEWRLGSAERGAQAGFRFLGIAPLMGLEEFRTEQFLTGLHAEYLIKNYWKSQVSLSFPRIRKAEGNFTPYELISDTNLVQSMLAHRLFQHDIGLAISTREPAQMRDSLLPLGVTQMSAGSKTEPGGYSQEHDGKQFEIEDKRSVQEFCDMLRSKGYDPVMKDWDRSFLLGA
ncbi:MAG: 2-iminoacetate synthase ThiH [Denitrovibrio sp.]|nr:MAG: 2-iminoacetate synthase ThiH [Denitrovibrio sp.]